MAPPSLASRQPPAAFICPGHPLLDAVLDLTLERGRGLLQRGAVLVDERGPGVGVRVLFTLEHAIRDGSRLPNGEGRTISRRLLYVEIDADGRTRRLRHAPYLDYRPLAEGEPAAGDVLARPECAWIGRELEAAARREAIAHVVPEHVAEVRDRRAAWIDKTRAAVKDRLTKEIAHWDHRADRIKHQEQAGKAGAGARANAESITVTKNEVLTALNKPEDFILAIVVFPEDEGEPGVRYVHEPFEREPDFGAVSVNYKLANLLARSEPPR